MVRIIAPACPRCQTQMRVDMIYAELDDLDLVNPIDINLAKWMVSLDYSVCRLDGDLSIVCSACLRKIEEAQ